MRNITFAPSLAARIFVGLLAFFLFTACALLRAAPSLAGEDIVFDGSNPGLLQVDPLFSTPDSLFPGTTASPGLSGNSVSVIAGHILGQVYGGITVLGGNENVTGNTVKISGGVIDAFVSGGRSDRGNAFGNTVNISGGIIGKVFGNVYGGESNLGNALNNTVNITGGTIIGNVAGSKANNGNASGNTVNISGGESGGFQVYGGQSGFSNATSNTVILAGQPILRDHTFIWGGFAFTGGDEVGRQIRTPC